MSKIIVYAFFFLILLTSLGSLYLYFFRFLEKEGINSQDIEQVRIILRTSLSNETFFLKNRVSANKSYSTSPFIELSDSEVKKWLQLVKWSKKEIGPQKAYGNYEFELLFKGGEKLRLLGGNSWIRRTNGDFYFFGNGEFFGIFDKAENI